MKRNMINRLLSVLISISIVIGSMSVSALATDGTDIPEEHSEATEDMEIANNKSGLASDGSSDSQMSWSEVTNMIAQGYVYMHGDCFAESGDSALVIPEGQMVDIDLNGYTLSRNLSSPRENGSVIIVRGVLTIRDSSSDHSGVITGGNTTGAGGGISVQKGGQLHIISGNIKGNQAVNGGGIYNGDTVDIGNGTITGNTATNSGGGIFNPYNSDLTLTNCTISGNKAAEGYQGGGIHNDGELNIGSGIVKIKDNTKGGTANNLSLYYDHGSKITFLGKLKDGSEIGVTRRIQSSISSPIEITSDNNGYNDKYLTADSSNCKLTANGNGEIVMKWLVGYIDGQGKSQTPIEDYTIFRHDMYELNNGWYVVSGGVGMSSNQRLMINGNDVNIILLDGASLNTNGFGICVNSGNSLTIWAQSTGSNAGAIMSDCSGLNRETGQDLYHPGIGSSTANSSGDITINGGRITAKGGYWAAGIGGGNGACGNVTINGGTVTAVGGHEACGIGGGAYGGGGNIRINGGSVTATGSDGGAGIGAGVHAVGGTVYLDYDIDNPATSVKASSYKSNNVKLVKAFKDGNTGTVYYATGAYSPVSDLANKVLTPARYTDGMGEHLAGNSLSLEEDIGVNFYMELDPAVAASDDAYMEFIVPSGASTETQRVYVKQQEDTSLPHAVLRTEGNVTYYVFKCGVAAKEMTSSIKARMHVGNHLGKEYTYSVVDYAAYILDNAYEQDGVTAKNEEYVRALPLVKAILNYGAYSQEYFGVNKSNLANSILSPDECGLKGLDQSAINIADPVTDMNGGVTFEGASLSLKSTTTLSLYFKSSDTLSFSCDGYKVDSDSSGEYQIARIRGIKASDVGKSITLTVGSHGTVVYSPLNYCKTIIGGNYDTKLMNVVTAFYMYYEAARDY